MKRSVYFFIVLIVVLQVIVVFVQAQETGTTDPTQQYEDIQGNIDKIPLDNNGNIDDEKLNESFVFFSSKAEERIDAINLWVETNTPWLQFIFQMIPSISWLFFWNVLIMVNFFTVFVLNAGKNVPFFDTEIKRRLLGFCFFIVLLLFRFYYFLAWLNVEIFDFFWNVILDWGIVITLILAVVFAALLTAAAIFGPIGVGMLLRFIIRMTGKKVAKNNAEVGLVDAENKFNELNKKTQENLERQEEFSKSAGI